MTKSDEDFDQFAFAAFAAIAAFASARIEKLANGVRWWAQRHPPTGIWGGDVECRHLWDEYRAEKVNGPTEALASAWVSTFQPHIAHSIGGLPHHDAVLITIAGQWQQDDFRDQNGRTVDPDLISQLVWQRLSVMAGET